MAHAKEDHRQRQANHFKALLDDAQAEAADPASTPEEVAEAEQTVADMTANLQRLADKYNVVPTP